MPSKMVNDRRKLNRALRTAITVHEPAVLKGLRERLGPFLEGDEEALAGLGRVHQALQRYLRVREEELVAADQEVHTDRLDKRPALRQRDDAVRALRAHLVESRQFLRGSLGTTVGDELLALDGRLPEEPLRLHRQGVITLGRLRDPEVRTPPIRLAGIQIDREALADELEPKVEALRVALEEVDRDRKHVLLAQQAKKKALELHDVGTRTVAGFLSYLYRLSGNRLMADRLKPALRRRPKPEDVEALARSPEPPAVQQERDDGDRRAGTDPPAASSVETPVANANEVGVEAFSPEAAPPQRVEPRTSATGSNPELSGRVETRTSGTDRAPPDPATG